MKPLGGLPALDAGRRPFASRLLAALGTNLRRVDAEGIDFELGSTIASVERAVVPGVEAPIAAALTDVHLVFAGLAAAHARARSARVNEREVVLSCLGEALPAEVCGQRRPEHSLSLVECDDGHVGVSTGEDVWTEFVATSGWPRKRDELVAEAQAWRLPALPARTLEEALAEGPPRPFRFRLGPECGSAASPARFDDLRVLDLGMMWAGPYCGQLLTQLGVDVTKIEGPTRKDGTRRSDGECAGVFADLNAGKKSLSLDLGFREGQQLFRQLAKHADVVVENFSRRVMANFGSDYEALWEVNPRLIVVSMPVFPSDSPGADYVAYGSGVELAAGLAPWRAGRPEPSPIAYLDYLSGAAAASAVAAALLFRDRKGQGMHVEVAQYEIARMLLQDGPMQTGYRPDVAALVAGSPGLTRPCQAAHSHLQPPPFRIAGLSARSRRARELGADSQRILRQQGWGGREQRRLLAAAGVIG
ncbi:MAG: CoA transferase [Chloroflexi bacterium]|nr:CoA transferase [Chloroflexota bacterium]